VRDQSYKIELFVFPDGTSVEMIVFDADRRRDARAPARTSTRTQTTDAPTTAPAPCRVPPPPHEDLDARTCPVCGSRLIYPVDWERSGDAAWTLQLRCPECETRREVTLGRASIEHINRELYHGAQAMAHEAARMTRRNFEDEAEWIVAALERDLIQPMDF
jgi:DNA-directed RNA polymerase subunit RPC12/RpoP